MSPTRKPSQQKRAPAGVVKARAKRAKADRAVTPKAKILRSTPVHRLRAHTAAAGQRRQARRDSK